ncbi:MAG TPA: PspC domain-containing protein [Bacteroidales bacterium]|jgi:phage shock protein PspC (stress-responsive transcriptional regulator)|nr:PspC domain-containing protein [Bacteroidales bacterium]HPK30275.1 PspC domain-containing protein [Bacteroidales bacterium]
MKKVVNAGIGGRPFILEEDAFSKLESYLSFFKSKINMGSQEKEVMDDLEMRIADLFEEKLGSGSEVVTLQMVEEIISRLGMPDGSSPFENGGDTSSSASASAESKGPRKLYRDPDDRVIGGVCSGLAQYLNIDVVLVRILFVVFTLIGGAGIWVYIILWIVAPQALTAAQKCEMRGWPVTAENIRKASQSQNRK